MIPETNIKNAISDLWIERFPDQNTTNFPKGLIKRISMVAIKNKTGIVSGQYTSRISIIWYDLDSRLFDAKMASIIATMDTIKSDANITSVAYDGRTSGVDPETRMEVMNLDFIIKHYI